MSIDWFTVAAQIVNFLVLAWLLTRLLYRPILQAIAEREKKTLQTLQDAEAKRAEAESARLACELQTREFQDQKQGLWQHAAAEAGASQEALLAAARQDVADLRTKWLRALEAEKSDLREELRRRLESEIWAVVRQVLQDLSDAPLGVVMAEAFARRLRAASAAEKAQLAELRTAPGAPPSVRCAVELPPAARDHIAGALRDIGFAASGLRFEVQPNLVSGIELVAGGYKIEWSVASYLGGLERAVEDVLKQAHEPDPARP